MTGNFEKDINVPSKKIIIDGVDVSGCESFCRGICCQEGFGASASCKLFSDCLYKELKRKEQELEQYKASKQASYEALQKRCNELELENRKLKQTLTETKEIANKFDYWNNNLSQASRVLNEIIEKVNEVIDEENI